MTNRPNIIQKVTVNAMHISTANISSMATVMSHMLLLSSNRYYYMLFRLAYLRLTLANFKGQGPYHANFNGDYVVNGDKYSKTLLKR